jgi:metal transporter CNNM
MAISKTSYNSCDWLDSIVVIVIFAEIVPQAIFGRNQLLTGVKTRYLTWTFFYLMAPLTYPISKFLDWLLGEELGTTYSRDELRQLLVETHARSKLDSQEVNVLRGALEVRLLSPLLQS